VSNSFPPQNPIPCIPERDKIVGGFSGTGVGSRRTGNVYLALEIGGRVKDKTKRICFDSHDVHVSMLHEVGPYLGHELPGQSVLVNLLTLLLINLRRFPSHVVVARRLLLDRNTAGIGLGQVRV